MSYCLNPAFQNPSNPEDVNQECCENCECKLLLNERYRVVGKLGKGGFATTYEVVDNGKSKVLKVLRENHPKNVALFKREAKVLKELKHSGIPKLEEHDGYFTFEAGIDTLHCLVMEKIDGIDLEKWFENRNNQPITEDEAIAWLSQLIDILEVLHHKWFFHRDIKPCNIMVRPDDQLVLIDFGVVRELTGNYLEKTKQTGATTTVNSHFFTPKEQLEGKAKFESDFYALGGTFIYLLTGKAPNELEENGGKVLWRDSTKQISKPFADLIDWLIEPDVEDRPPNTKYIRKSLEAIKSNQIAELPKIKNAPRRWRLVRRLCGSVAVTGLVMGVRLTGILQSWELGVFDGMMRSRPAEPIDPRILVVEITQEDVGGTYPVKDLTLAKLIEKIAQHQPRVIGLDIHRYEARPPGRKEFIQQFQNNSNLLTICAALEPTPNFRPPDEFSQKQLMEQMGYSDLIGDYWIDNSRRRQFLSYDPKFRKSPRCITPYSLSLVLAKRFLQAEGKPLTTLPNGDWHHDQVILKPLDARTGGYQNLSGVSNEILINYRANFKPAEKVTLKQVLAGIKPELIKERIVLIGYTASVARDDFNTPLGEMAGVWIHAHMTSQIISAVIDKRPLLWTFPQWGDAIFVWVWSLAGGAIAWLARSPQQFQQLKWIGIFAVAGGGVGAGLYLICYGTLVIGGWMPLVPSVLSLFSSGVLVFYIASKN